MAELGKRCLKNILLFLSVVITAMYLPQQKLNIQDVLLIALIATSTYMILEMYAPTVKAAVTRSN